MGGAANDQTLNDVRMFDLATDMWVVPTVSGSPPPALVGHSATLIGSELFVFGGRCACECGLSTSLSLVGFGTLEVRHCLSDASCRCRG